MNVLILVFGFIFGSILQYAKLNKYNTISGLAIRENLTVAKAIAIAIGVGAILLSIVIDFGWASYHTKPFILGGIALGGIIFGSGMAMLGYCPGTLAISLGQGSVDALLGIIGGLAGGLVYTLVLPTIQPILGPNLGELNLSSTGLQGFSFYLVTFIIGGGFIAASFWLNKIDKTKSNKWILAGIALAILDVIVFLHATSNRPIGASTTYPYLADVLSGTTDNDYFSKVKTPGSWELLFLGGAFLAGLVISLVQKEFKITLIHDNWKKYKNNSLSSRIIWSLVGGFVLIFGARMAGGCTSGHILSGGMQLAVSSLVFGIFVFAGLLITGKLFYKKK